jgi:glycosyltransferase involved in cell wall biosynthesis
VSSDLSNNQNRIFVNARFLTRRITGLERYAIEISREMKRIRPSLTFVTPGNVLHHSIAEELGAVVVGRMTGHLWEQFELPRFLHRTENSVLLNLMNTGPLRFHNQLTVIHDLAFLRNPRWFSRRAALWFKFLVPRVVNASRIIVTQSAYTRSEVIALLGVPESKIHVVYPGIAKIFNDAGEKRARGKSGSKILTVSTLEPRKNVRRLIEAFNLLGRKDAELLIVGGDNPLVFGVTQSEGEASRHPNIRFLGYVPDDQLANLYREADVFASVSLYEGFGFPPLEALASGCKVLLSDIPSYRETMGNAATFVNPSDAAEIAHNLGILLDSDLAPEALELRETFDRFNWHQAAEEIMTLAGRLPDAA